MSTSNEANSFFREQLRSLIAQHFDLSELKTLCFDLRVDFDELKGENKSDKIRELISYIERHFRLNDLLAALTKANSNVSWPSFNQDRPQNPYRGLDAFREMDAPFFFGREAFTQRLLTTLRQKDLVAVIGPSGSGKSSVVFAGLLPHLHREGKWLIAHFRSGKRPFHALAATLLPYLEPGISETDVLAKTPTLANTLQTGNMMLEEVIGRILQKQPTSHHMLLVIDQFEELYTLCPEPKTRDTFLDILLQAAHGMNHTAVGSQRSEVKLVLTLRADFMGQALIYRPLADALHTANVMLGPMTREEMRQTIQKPAETLEVKFESGLVDRILDDVLPLGGQPELGNLPLLEFALTLLWEWQTDHKLNHVAYETIGQVKGALVRYAEEVYEGLSPAEQELLPRLLVQLVQPGVGTEDTRRLAARAELINEQWQLIQRLAGARLVVTNRDKIDQETAEIVHEALIQRWKRLQEWMQEHRTFRLWQERLRAAMGQWAASNKDEGALLRGAPLGEAQGWLAERGIDLGERERDFIQASVALKEKETAEREAQHQKELRAAQQLVEAQQRRIVVVRRALFSLIALLIVALIAAGIAINATDLANSRAVEADEARGTAVANANALATEEVNARTNAQEAVVQATTAYYAQATAEAGEAVAIQAQKETERQSRINLAQSLAAQAINAMQSQDQDPELATLLAIEAASINREENGQLEWLVDNALRQILSVPYFRITLQGYTPNVRSVAFSPDGQTLASGGEDGTVQLWDLRTPAAEPMVLHGHEGSVRSVAFSPDGQTLATGSLDNTIRLWQMANPEAEPVVLHGHVHGVMAVAFSPDGQTLASGEANSSSSVRANIRLWNVETPQADQIVLQGHSYDVLSLAFSPDGQTLASSSSDDTIRLWNLRNPKEDPLVLHGHTEAVGSVVFSPDGQILVSAGSDDTIRLWALSTLEVEPVILHNPDVNSVAFSPDGHTLASGRNGGDIWLWNLATLGAEPVVLRGAEGSINSVVFSPNGLILATGVSLNGIDGVIQLWDLGTPTAEPIVLKGDENNIVSSIAFSPDGLTLASGETNNNYGSTRLWDLETSPVESIILEQRERMVSSVTFSPNGEILATASLDNTIRLWNLRNLEAEPIVLSDPGGTFVAFSPDGQSLASGGVSNAFFVWNLTNLELEPLVFWRHDTGLDLVVFSPDGQTLVSGGSDLNTLGLWVLKTPGAEPMLLEGHQSIISSVAFSPDGHTLASGSYDKTIRLWDLETPGVGPIVLHGHEDDVSSIAFSPDGRILASGSDDQTIRLWNLGNLGAEPITLRGYEGSVNSVVFSPNGEVLAGGSSDGTIRLWIFLDQLIEIGCRQVRRNLTWDEWQRYLPNEQYRQTCPNLPIHPSVPQQ